MDTYVNAYIENVFTHVFMLWGIAKVVLACVGQCWVQFLFLCSLLWFIIVVVIVVFMYIVCICECVEGVYARLLSETREQPEGVYSLYHESQALVSGHQIQ